VDRTAKSFSHNNEEEGGQGILIINILLSSHLYPILFYPRPASINPNKKEVLVWSGDGKNVDFFVRNVYNAILASHFLPVKNSWQRNFWKWRLPLKVNLFFWLAIQNKILTWDNLQWKGKTGLSKCCLCGKMTENSKHIFIDYVFTRSVWEKSAKMLNCNFLWDNQSLMESMDNWVLNKNFSKRLSIITCWIIWKERNMTLFDNWHPNAWDMVYKILDILNIYPPVSNEKGLRLSSILRMNGYALTFFDGAALAGGSNYGVGGAIKCSNS
jgi:hypothetical protein